jgi:hypothetical protein
MRSPEEKLLRQTVKAKYDKIILDHKKVFDKEIVPFDEADLKEIKKTQRILTFVLGPIVIALIGVTLLFVWDGTYMSYLFLIFLLLLIALVFFYNQKFRVILESGKKEVFKGVILDKRKDDDGDSLEYTLMIGEQEWITVAKEDFRSNEIGDVISVEVLNPESSLNLKRKVTRIGNVFEWKAE